MTEHPSKGASAAEGGGDPPGTEDPPGEPRTLLPLPWAIWFWAQARKIVIGVIGATVILAGIAMLILPGPGWLTIFGGLAILATEFAWARWMLKFAKQRVRQLAEKYVGLSPGGGDASHDRPETAAPRDPAASA